MLERKQFSLKAGAMSETGSLEGYGAAYGILDRGGDLIRPGACKNIADFIKSGALMVSHDWGGLGVGTISDARQDDTGLWFSSDFYSDDESQKERQRAKDRLDRGKDVGLSIGYETLKATWGEDNGTRIRYLDEINVYEISLVGVPMNPGAGATGAKSFETRSGDALAALRATIAEIERIKTLRTSDGRAWPSDMNRSRIEAFAAETDELQKQLKALLESVPKQATDEDLAHVHAAMQANMRALIGTP